MYDTAGSCGSRSSIHNNHCGMRGKWTGIGRESCSIDPVTAVDPVREGLFTIHLIAEHSAIIYSGQHRIHNVCMGTRTRARRLGSDVRPPV